MSVTTENYLKAIYAQSESARAGLVSLGEVAMALGVTPGTVTTMMKNLSDAGLVDYRPRSGVLLTEPGRRAALEVIRRHRIIELFLVRVLDLDWASVHEEAEELEHAVSDRLLDRMDEYLGFPSADPHGDPIPTADGRMPARVGVSLADVGVPGRVTVVRVDNDESDFLEYLASVGLVPGTDVAVENRSSAASTMRLHVAGIDVTIGLPTARRILVHEST